MHKKQNSKCDVLSLKNKIQQSLKILCELIRKADQSFIKRTNKHLPSISCTWQITELISHFRSSDHPQWWKFPQFCSFRAIWDEFSHLQLPFSPPSVSVWLNCHIISAFISRNVWQAEKKRGNLYVSLHSRPPGGTAAPIFLLPLSVFVCSFFFCVWSSDNRSVSCRPWQQRCCRLQEKLRVFGPRSRCSSSGRWSP